MGTVRALYPRIRRVPARLELCGKHWNTREDTADDPREALPEVRCYGSLRWHPALDLYRGGSYLGQLALGAQLRGFVAHKFYSRPGQVHFQQGATLLGERRAHGSVFLCRWIGN